METSKSVVDTLGLVQNFWAPMFLKELRENTLWGSLLADPNYTLDKVKGGDTYKISQINKPTSTIKTIGVDADTFDTNVLSTTQNDLVVNRRCVSGFEFSDLSVLMSQLENADSDIREALLADVREQMNDHIKSLINPSSSAPDHLYSGVSDFNETALSATRKLAATAKWGNEKPWYLLADVSFFSDLLSDTTLSAANTMGTNISPMLNGRYVLPRMNFNIVEDNSLATDTAFAFRADFMKVIFGTPRFKISDLHALGQFGYKLSVDFVLGARQVNDKKIIKIYNS